MLDKLQRSILNSVSMAAGESKRREMIVVTYGWWVLTRKFYHLY